MKEIIGLKFMCNFFTSLSILAALFHVRHAFGRDFPYDVNGK